MTEIHGQCSSAAATRGRRRVGWRLFGVVVLASVAWVGGARAAEPGCPGSATPDPRVIWCDDFDDGAPLAAKYFEYDSAGGSFVPVPGTGLGGSVGMRAVWQTGQVSAGNIKRTFGRNPVNSQSHSSTDFPEIYWRQYLKMEEGWTGNPYKLSRATSLASGSWAQAMIAHLWASDIYLAIDPATGIDSSGTLVTTTYNDFPNLTWLGLRRGPTAIFTSAAAGRWYCIEAHARLNTSGASDGVFEFWIDGGLEARRADLNWVGTWRGYGINALFFENYWNNGAPGQRVRYFDNIVISTVRIGCLDQSAPNPPTNLQVR